MKPGDKVRVKGTDKARILSTPEDYDKSWEGMVNRKDWSGDVVFVQHPDDGMTYWAPKEDVTPWISSRVPLSEVKTKEEAAVWVGEKMTLRLRGKETDAVIVGWNGTVGDKPAPSPIPTEANHCPNCHADTRCEDHAKGCPNNAVFNLAAASALAAKTDARKKRYHEWLDELESLPWTPPQEFKGGGHWREK